jgi:molybdate transport system ATP-binding protein
MRKPKILLLDEPFSALDMEMREKLQKDVYNFHKKFDLTTVMVSHSPSEIYRLSDYAMLLKNGQVIKFGQPSEVLLKTSGSAKFSFEGRILDIVKEDVIYIAVVEIGEQIAEVVVSEKEAEKFEIGEKVVVGTKAYNPYIKKAQN